jgi:hypothetical protein
VSDDEERQLRIELMTVQIDQGRLNIDKMRADMTMSQQKLDRETRHWFRVFVLQIATTVAASVAAGAAALGLILHWMGKL